ncbi:MAG: hypothetical protein V9E94_01380 [Microthrixaceae bacterium]
MTHVVGPRDLGLRAPRRPGGCRGCGLRGEPYRPATTCRRCSGSAIDDGGWIECEVNGLTVEGEAGDGTDGRMAGAG